MGWKLTRRAALAAVATPFIARAEDWPTRSVRLIVGFVAGGGTDITARILAPKLSEQLGQPVVVDNRPGGAGNLANELAARAAPDGYTLMLGTISQLAVTNALIAGLPVNPLTDFATISLAVEVTNLLVVPADRPWRSVAELVAEAKARPGQLTYGSSSIGSAGHLSAALLDQAAGIETVHVPYRGGGQLITDIITGKVDFSFATAATTVQHVQTGRLRAIAVPTARRSALVPEVPTVAETGVPGYDVSNWYGLVGPRALPAAVVARLHQAMAVALADAEVLQKMALQGLEPRPSTPEQFADYMKAETERWTRVVRAAGISGG